jgi:hypothetical protein
VLFDGTLQVIDLLGDLSCLGFILEIAWFWCGMTFMVTLRYHQLGGGNIAGNGGCKFARPEIVFYARVCKSDESIAQNSLVKWIMFEAER